MGIHFVYITAGSLEEAKSIGHALVEERLAACVNMFDGMRSIYRWKGALEEAQEVVVIAKTRSALVKKLIKRVEQLHSYETPCALAFKITDGTRGYVRWLQAETAQPKKRERKK